jgi:hypothetical protein
MTELGEFREGEPNHHIEILKLYELEGRRRAFDVSNGTLIIAGVVSLDTGWEDGPRIYVYIDREDPHGNSYAVKPSGSIEELQDDETFSALVIQALRHMPLPAGRTRYFTAEGMIDPETN